jgi:hypothetical protein
VACLFKSVEYIRGMSQLGSKIQEFADAKEDLRSQLAANLMLEPEERLLQHQSSLELVEQLQAAMSEANEKPQQTPSSTPRK